MRSVSILILMGAALLRGGAEGDLKALQARFPGVKTAYTQWEYEIDQPSAGFWKGVTEHQERFHGAWVLLRSDPKAARVVKSALPASTKLAEAWVSWTLPDGKVEKVPLERFTAKVVGAETRYELPLPALPEGTRVEEHFVGTVPGALHGFNFKPLPEDGVILKGHFRLIMQQGLDFKLKNVIAEQADRKLSNEILPDKRRQVTLDLSGVGPRIPEPLAPFRVPARVLTWDIRSYPEYLRSPVQIIQQFNLRMASRSPWFSQAVQDSLGKIVEGKNTPLERVEAVLAFIQSKIRRIGSDKDSGGGLFGLARMDFADMLSKGEATPDGMLALMREMLSKLGIPAKLVLIHSVWNGPFDPDYIASHEDYEGAVWVDLEGKSVMAFPHRPERPLGHLDRFQLGRPAVVIRDANTLEVLKTPSSVAVENRYEESWALEVEPSGRATLQFERDVHGPEALDMRAAWKRLPDAKRAQAGTVWGLCSGAPLGMATQGSVKNPEEKDKPLKVQLTLQLPVVCKRKEGGIELNPYAAAMGLGLSEVIPLEEQERTEPLWIPYDQVIHRVLRIKVPAGWKLPSPLPAPMQVQNGLGSAESSVALEGEAIRIDQTLKLRHGLHPASKGTELLQLTGAKSPLVLPSFLFK